MYDLEREPLHQTFPDGSIKVHLFGECRLSFFGSLSLQVLTAKNTTLRQ